MRIITKVTVDGKVFIRADKVVEIKDVPFNFHIQLK